jgi:hypothetical protein
MVFLIFHSSILVYQVLEDLCFLRFVALLSDGSMTLFLYFELTYPAYLPLIFHCCNLILVKYLLNNVTSCLDELFLKATDWLRIPQFKCLIPKPLKRGSSAIA